MMSGVCIVTWHHCFQVYSFDFDMFMYLCYKMSNVSFDHYLGFWHIHKTWVIISLTVILYLYNNLCHCVIYCIRVWRICSGISSYCRCNHCLRYISWLLRWTCNIPSMHPLVCLIQIYIYLWKCFRHTTAPWRWQKPERSLMRSVSPWWWSRVPSVTTSLGQTSAWGLTPPSTKSLT